MISPKRRLKMFTFLIIIVAIIFFLGSKDLHFKKLTSIISKINQHQAPWVSQGHLINTLGCVLPKTRFLPNGFHMIKDYEPRCDFEKRIVTINDETETLKLTEDGIANMGGNPAACLVIDIRHFKPMFSFRIGANKFNLTETTPLDISDKELVVTKCGRFVNFDAHFPLSQNIRNKMDFWKTVQTTKSDPMPINVLFMGIDSTSRSHFYRSLPKTLPLLSQMGFIDFKGFHSMAPNTLENFFPFLMGLQQHATKIQPCGPLWDTGYDACPLIWNDYDMNNFVTMFIEDGVQTFRHREEMGGFLKKPTDYYTQPLFFAIKSLSATEYANNRTDDQCPSTLNSAKFLLDYTKRFLKKFMHTKTPFFSFSWLNYPFHDNTFSLYGQDDKIEEFFHFLNSDESREILENTLIIFNSDHGERFGDFVKNGYYEGFVERVLPGLFIRLPENLLKQFPELNLKETLKINSKRLTSGLDLHHTLLHLLKLQGLDIYGTDPEWNKRWVDVAEFNPVVPDRSSLFVVVNESRSCSDIKIPNEYCRCLRDTSTTGLSPTGDIDFQNRNPRYFQSLVDYAVEALNDVVGSSRFLTVCELHGTLKDSFVSWNVLYGTDRYTAGVLRFVTNLNRAEFDVQLKIHHEKNVTDIDSIKEISTFNRLNRYGNSSWCIISSKTMKELCHCKDRAMGGS